MHEHHQGTPARTITRLALYRTLRLIAGPALAYRVAFCWRA